MNAFHVKMFAKFLEGEIKKCESVNVGMKDEGWQISVWARDKRSENRGYGLCFRKRMDGCYSEVCVGPFYGDSLNATYLYDIYNCEDVDGFKISWIQTIAKRLIKGAAFWYGKSNEGNGKP